MRAEFDDALFRHAGAKGAHIFDAHKVTSLQFSADDPGRPIGAEWSSATEPTLTGSIAFDYLIDASGRQGILATKYHKDRTVTESMKVRKGKRIIH